MQKLIPSVQLGVIKLFGRLPLCVARTLGWLLGVVMSRLPTRNTRVTEANINLCFAHLSPQKRRQKIRASLVHSSILPFETCVIWARSQSWINQRVLKVSGESYMHEALAIQKGVILIAPHLGNWEMLGTQLKSYSAPTCMYQPPKQAFLDRFIYDKRKTYQMNLAPTNARGVAMCLKTLKKGGLVAILPDQNPTQGGEFAPFFGQATLTMTLIHGLIQRTGCEVIMGVAERIPGGFHQHFIAPDKRIFESDVAASTAGLNKSVEACVNICPDQYQWEYKRFKHRPQGAELIYAKR